MDNGRQIEAAKRCLAAAQDTEVRGVRQALARCAERYILGALGYRRTNEAEGAALGTAPSPNPPSGG